MTTWLEHVEKWKDCNRCPLSEQRSRICLGRGAVPCDMLFVGEGPGASEDAIGLPFVGPAGKLLDNPDEPGRPGIIQRAVLREMGVILAFNNLVPCFPREAKSVGENEPEHEEIMACLPRLEEFVNIAQPRLIVCVGSLATQYVDQRSSVECLNIIHPAAFLRKGRDGTAMPLAKKQMLIQKTVVMLRSAGERLIRTPRGEWKEWSNANLSQGRGLKQRFDAWTRDHADADIPF